MTFDVPVLGVGNVSTSSQAQKNKMGYSSFRNKYFITQNRVYQNFPIVQNVPFSQCLVRFWLYIFWKVIGGGKSI